MEEINVNETMDEMVDVVEEVAKTDSGKVLKILAGAGGTALVGLGVYAGYKLLNQKVIKPMIAKRNAKKETTSDEEDYEESQNC